MSGQGRAAMAMLLRFWQDRHGAEATEYALLGALAALVVMAEISTLGLTVGRVLQNVGGAVPLSIVP